MHHRWSTLVHFARQRRKPAIALAVPRCHRESCENARKRHGASRPARGGSTRGVDAHVPLGQDIAMRPPTATKKKGSNAPQRSSDLRVAACLADLATTRELVTRLELRIERLELELHAFRHGRARSDPPPLPLGDTSGSTIDVTELAELIEAPPRPNV
jgi:hypothetical protein